MIPTYRNSSPSSPSFPFELNNNEVHDLSHINPLVSPSYQVASSSSYSSCQTFFNNSTTNQDQMGYYRSQFYQPQYQPEVDNFASRSGSHDHLEKKNKGPKLTLWKKGDKLMQKMKNSDHAHIKLKLEDQKKQQSYPNLETDYSSNSSSNNSNNNNIPIRVCSDCNTTKTPLWRSGPKGPKTLCNACGIRQRKARRAMAAAAAANGETLTTETSSSSMKKKVKHLHKEKITNVNVTLPYKKRCKFGPSSSSNTAPKKLGNFEDFLIKLSNNLALHQIFPQDEKEAAILLMALSSGLVHG
uniref:GATA transcription factor 22 n=1 Tax=Nicotiana tabacum TaxID=4097 RepID=A0A1S4DAT1_TOBAC|nr:PREDICTED: putative GATA transcription factor 22 [Nicotiana tabacum]